jgi:hypothetical protein
MVSPYKHEHAELESSELAVDKKTSANTTVKISNIRIDNFLLIHASALSCIVAGYPGAYQSFSRSSLVYDMFTSRILAHGSFSL